MQMCLCLLGDRKATHAESYPCHAMQATLQGDEQRRAQNHIYSAAVQEATMKYLRRRRWRRRGRSPWRGAPPGWRSWDARRTSPPTPSPSSAGSSSPALLSGPVSLRRAPAFSPARHRRLQQRRRPPRAGRPPLGPRRRRRARDRRNNMSSQRAHVALLRSEMSRSSSEDSKSRSRAVEHSSSSLVYACSWLSSARVLLGYLASGYFSAAAQIAEEDARQGVRTAPWGEMAMPRRGIGIASCSW